MTDQEHDTADFHKDEISDIPLPPSLPTPDPKPADKKGEYSNILKVKADPPDITPEDRKKNAKNLAGAIAHGLRQYGEVYVRCFSNATCGKGSKAIAIARGYVAVQGFDLYCAPSFITADIGGQERTGICYWCFTNKTGVGQPPQA